MQELYNKILKKPKEFRRRLAYVLTAVIGVIIFSIWLIMASKSMKNVFNDSSDKVEKAVTEKKNNLPSLEDRTNSEEVIQ